MNAIEFGSNLLARLNPRVAGVLERSVKRVPFVRAKLDEEYDKMLAGMDPQLHPYRSTVPAQRRCCRRNNQAIGREQIRRYFRRRHARTQANISSARLLNQPKDSFLLLRSGSGAHQQKNHIGKLLRDSDQKVGALGHVDASGIGSDAKVRLETEAGARFLLG